MKINIDQNGIICIDGIINQAKQYAHNFFGFSFSDYDKITVVKHKKEIKTLNWKNIGDGMSVFFLQNRKNFIIEKINKIGFLLGFCLFSGFDEETGKTNHFLYKIKETEYEKLNDLLQFVGINSKFEKQEKGFFLQGEVVLREVLSDNLNDFEFLISFLFALVLIYGSLEIRNGDLNSFKIHIPLFGMHENKKEIFDQILQFFKENGLFLQKNVIKSNNGIVYQISCQDYELLKIFKERFGEKLGIQKVGKLDLNSEINQNLIKFFENGNFENTQEIKKILTDGTLKTLQNK